MVDALTIKSEASEQAFTNAIEANRESNNDLVNEMGGERTGIVGHLKMMIQRTAEAYAGYRRDLRAHRASIESGFRE